MTFYDGQTKDMPSHNYGALAHVLNKYFGQTTLPHPEGYVLVTRKNLTSGCNSRKLHAKMMLYLSTIEKFELAITIIWKPYLGVS